MTKPILSITKQIVSCLLLVAVSAYGQINSIIVDSNDNPIVGATITTNLPSVGTLSDTDGTFSLKSTESITRLTVSSVGYQPRQFTPANLPAKIVLEPTVYELGGITVNSSRAQEGITPIAFENFSAEDIKREYTVGEFPLLLATTPNVHSFADGGAPLGYSYTKIRGFDDKRIITYINGVPLNDPEDHATYFVDLPDFAANVTDIQVQRGVGNSLYGDGSFGGSINIVTSAFDKKRSASLTAGYGVLTHDGSVHSDMYKQAVSYNSGLLDGRWAFSGRFSKQKSGGYRRNSWYDGWSYYFSLGRVDPNMTTELYVYGGPIRMHLSYWGAPRSETVKDWLYNPLSYSNETDNFNQPHYHLHNRYKINEHTTLTNTIYYIRGKGYYEQLKDDRDYADYSLTALSDSSSGDVVRQQWVKKNQVGWNPTLEISHDKGSHAIGGSFYYFNSDHWGQVVWAEHLNSSFSPRQKYYQYFGKKYVGSIFVQEHFQLSEKVNMQAAVQLRFQKYTLDQIAMGTYVGYDYDLNWLFLSPRLGVNYRMNENQSLFANISVASRTPSDVAIFDANEPSAVPSLDANGDLTADAERLYDFELGWQYRSPTVETGLNLFWMEFKNEIIPNGGINQSGILYTINADRSVHAGVEFTSGVRLNELISLNGNMAYNYNRIKEYIATIDGFDFDFADKTIPLFPDYLGNLRVDLTQKQLTGFLSFKFVGKQFMELSNSETDAIESYQTAALGLSYTVPKVFGDGTMEFKLHIDNLFDKQYEISGYGGNYAWDDGNINLGSWAEYFVAPERTIYGQIALNLY